MVLRVDGERTARRSSAKLIFRHVILQGAGNTYIIALAIGMSCSVPSPLPWRVKAVQPWKVRNMEHTAGDATSRASGRWAASKASYSRQLPEKT